MRILRRNVIGLLICLLWIGNDSLISSNDVAAAEKRSLWKIQAKNNTIYILGSIHYLKAQNYPLAPAIEDAFRDAKKLVFEVNLDSMEKESGSQLMLMKGLYAGGTTLKDHIAEKTYASAAKEMKELGVDVAAFNQFKPWLTAITLTALKLQKLGFDPKQGIDQYFYRKAKNENKEVDGLETLEFQIDLFDGMPERTQEMMLVQTLKDISTMEKEVEAIIKAWASGDVKAMESALLQSMREYPEVYQRLVSDRNRGWIPKIESYLSQSENYLIVVGAGHLAGKDSIIEMLKAKGYSVEQL
ncbi:MAG: TraB/GumN family protein [Deltaproteobacteria bacterium]|nr:MAG: TraB/GumN family protein [Deltaproteobacteria bacterium]